MSKARTRRINGIDVEHGSTNAYADLGFPDAADMAVKSDLVRRISEGLRSRGLTQVEAASVLGLTQPKLSKILRGHFHGVSERKLIDCLNRLGHDVEIVVKQPRAGGQAGKVSVVLA
jgi:predicted XRE-type DNA-binding protein